MRVVVTGATGINGTAIVKELMSPEHQNNYIHTLKRVSQVREEQFNAFVVVGAGTNWHTVGWHIFPKAL